MVNSEHLAGYRVNFIRNGHLHFGRIRFGMGSSTIIRVLNRRTSNTDPAFGNGEMAMTRETFLS
jgi:hypothetical protein